MKKSFFISLIDHYSFLFFLITLSSFLFLIFEKKMKMTEAYLISALFFNIGIRGLIAFFMNWIPRFAVKIAINYEWPTYQSFQKEVASADGAFGVLGISSLWFSGDFWTATVIGFTFCTIFSEIAGLKEVALEEKTANRKFNSFLKRGMLLDLILSFILLFCLILWKNGL